MCFKVKTPQIKNEVSATQLVPSMENKEPESPVFGETDAWSTKRKGKEALKINLADKQAGYNPLRI